MLINGRNTNMSFYGVKSLPSLSRPVAEQADDILRALNMVSPNIQKLNQGTHVYGVRKTLELLKKTTGLDTFSKEGISFKLEGKKIRLGSPDSSTLIVEELGNKNQKLRDVKIRFNRLENADGFSSGMSDVNAFLSNIFEKLDFALLQIRKFFVNSDINSVMEKLVSRASFRNENAKLVDDIRTLFVEIQAEIDSISNLNSRSRIKNGYQFVKKGGTHGSKQIDFENIGTNNEKFSVNILSGRTGEKHLYIKIQGENSEPKHFFINPKGEALKETNFSRVLKVGDKNVYCSQRELDSPLLGIQLETLKNEMVKYKQYIQAAIQRREILKEHMTTGEIGVIDEECLDLIKTVRDLLKACKTRIKNIKEADRKKALKQKYRIETVMSSPSLNLKDITPAHESIYLSFPVMQGVECLKIIILGQNDKIKKSLFINGDKMIKFNATSLGRSKRKDTLTNYHSQEEIDNSGLREYLLMAKSRLESVPLARKKGKTA